MDFRTQETEGELAGGSEAGRDGDRSWGPNPPGRGPLTHLSQLESWLWLAAISRMSSISSDAEGVL